MPVATPSKSAVAELIELVRREGYRPGDRLPPIRQLSTALGLGRNAVRDGLLEAQTRGLVRIEPRLGVFLEGLELPDPAAGLAPALDKALRQDAPNLLHLVDARLVVEVELAGEAARMRRPEELLPLRQALEMVLASGGDRLDYIRADQAFHMAIGSIAANRVLLAFLQTLWPLIAPAKMNLLLSTESRQVSDREHQDLFQSIVDGSADRARAIMRAHIGKGRNLLLDYARTVPLAESQPGGQ